MDSASPEEIDNLQLETKEEKKRQLLELLKQRNEERKEKLEKGKSKKDENIAEKTLIFSANFKKLEQEILLNLGDAEPTTEENLMKFFEANEDKIKSLQEMIQSSSHFLNAFHLRKFQERYEVVMNKQKQLKDTLLPRKRFAFKPKQKELNKPIDMVDTSEKNRKVYKFEYLEENGFKGRSNEELSLTHEELDSKDITLSSLVECKVKLFGSCSTLHITGLKSCKIFSGLVSTSIFIEGCNDCTFVIACQQLRIHSTQDCDFYTNVRSRSIIEDCKNVKFAPYNWSYPNMEKHFKTDINNWSSIDDFNCPSSNVVSPNWSIIDEGDRVTNWD